MKQSIKDALKILRSEGIRIPQSLTKRLHKRTGHTASRADIKKFKERVTHLTNGHRLVVGINKKGALTFHALDAYQAMVRTASNARDHIKGKNHGKGT